MTSEALELRVQGRRVGWYMCVVRHGNDGLGGGRDGVGGWYVCGKSLGLVVCREMPEHFLSAR